MFGVSISPPYGSIAEKPTSSKTTYNTLGAPGGATGSLYGPQSGVESLISIFATPLNGSRGTEQTGSSVPTGRGGAIWASRSR